MIANTTLYAQTAGYTKTSLFDDFISVKPYSDPNPADTTKPDGIFWWGKDLGGTSVDPCYNSNMYTLSRTGNGKLDVTVSQGNKCWQPMGIATKLDLTQNATFEISITNNSSEALYFNITAVDSDKKVTSCDFNGKNFAVSSLAAGATKVLSGDFTGGMRKVWINGTSSLVSGADISKIIGIDMTIVNANQPEINEWNPLPITDASITINYLKVGAQSNANGINDDLKIANFSISPNPSSGSVVDFSQVLTHVSVSNLLGQVLLTKNNTNTLNVSSLSQGIYILSSNVGTKTLIIE